MLNGHSILKWTILDPLKGLSDNDSQLYIDFYFCENTLKCLNKRIVYTIKHSMLSKSTLKMYALEYNASGVQVRDIEQIIF